MVAKNGSSALREIITLSDLAALCVVSERQIQRLAKQGVLRLAKDRNRRLLRGRYVLGDAVPRFIEHLRDSITSDDPNAAAYAEARARRMAANAEMMQLELRHKKGELLDGEHVDSVVMSLLLTVRNHLLALPSRITRQLLPHVADATGDANFQAVYSTVNGEVRAALTEASEFDVKQITARNQARQGAAEQTSLNGDDED
jgi:phage terminase Nu1 subunit (DNA packaging protein)